MSIYELLKDYKAYRLYEGEFGIEIETESLSQYKVPLMKYWTTTIDNSLRNVGLEYILKAPVKYAEIGKALQEFNDSTNHVKFINNPIGGSVHVHTNFLNESFQTLGNFLTCLALTENLLMEYSGPDRRSNLFCLPICDAEENLNNITDLFRGIENNNFKKIFQNEQAVKYANINVASFGTYGSIEVRSFRGETNIKEIRDWIDIIYKVLQYSRRDQNPKQIIDILKDKGTNILDDIFGLITPKLYCKDWQKKFDKNIWYAANIAYSIKKWEVLDYPKMKEFQPKVKELREIAFKMFNTEIENLNLEQIDIAIKALRDQFEKAEKERIKKELARKNPKPAPINHDVVVENRPQPQVGGNPFLNNPNIMVNQLRNHPQQNVFLQGNLQANGVINRRVVDWWDEVAVMPRKIDLP